MTTFEKKIALEIVNTHFNTLMRIDMNEYGCARDLVEELNDIDTKVESDVWFEIETQEYDEPYEKFANIFATIFQITKTLQNQN